MMKESIRINSITEIALTKLDVLSGIKQVKLGVCYRSKKDSVHPKLFFNIPCSEEIMNDLETNYRLFDGWDENIEDCRKKEDLPTEAQHYIKLLEEILEVPITIISVGPEKSQFIRND